MARSSRLPDNRSQETLRWYERIKNERLKQGLSQEEAARYLGVDTRTLRFWEAGRHVPGYRGRRELSRLYKKSLENLDLVDPQPIEISARDLEASDLIMVHERVEQEKEYSSGSFIARCVAGIFQPRRRTS